MSIEILDCLKRKRDICIKNLIPSLNTAFRWAPALMSFVWNYQNSRYPYLVKIERFCQQTWSWHALLLSYLSFFIYGVHVWGLTFPSFPTPLPIIQENNRNNIFLRTKIPFWASVQIPQSTYAQWCFWITDSNFCLSVVTWTLTSLFKWIFKIHIFCLLLFNEAIM